MSAAEAKANLQNTTHFFLYSTGCSANNFKVGSPYDPYGEAFGKAITTQTPYGAYAYMGHTSGGHPEEVNTYLQHMMNFTMQPSINPQESQTLGTILNLAVKLIGL